MSREKVRTCFSMADMHNPLFLHPSHGSSSIDIEKKLIGTMNNRSSHCSLEISLSTNRKLEYITGTVTRSDDDPVKSEA